MCRGSALSELTTWVPYGSSIRRRVHGTYEISDANLFFYNNVTLVTLFFLCLYDNNFGGCYGFKFNCI